MRPTCSSRCSTGSIIRARSFPPSACRSRCAPSSGRTRSERHVARRIGAPRSRRDRSSRARRAAVTVTAPAGGACLMHTRLLHGSAANRTQSPRTLFISVYAAADARPLSPNPMPSRYEGMLLRGVDRGRVRSQTFEMELPELPSGASFFEQQAAAEKEPAA
ncbi:MAG: phytanoyl-CoA dioxygenase family protein [Limibacillus sp.]